MGKLLKIIIALLIIAVAAFIVRSIFFANIDVENMVEGALDRADTVVEDTLDKADNAVEDALDKADNAVEDALDKAEDKVDKALNR